MKICFKVFAALTAAGFMAVAPGCEGSVPDPDGMKPGEGGGSGEDISEYFYMKVTAAPADWEGDYLITYTDNSSIKVFNDWDDDKYGQSTVDLYNDMTSQGIPAETADRYRSIIRKEGAGYSIYVSGVGYIGYSGSGNSLLRNTSESPSAGTDIWKISSGEDIHIMPVNSNETSRRLMWNSSSPRFACYKGTVQEITLYKKNFSAGQEPDDPDDNPDEGNPDEGEEGGETEIPDGINEDGNKNGWLVNWEVPHADVALPEDVAYSRTVSETEGNSYAYVCETNDAGRLIVTHTFTNNGRKYRNYTLLFDKDKKAALWVAYAMHETVWGGDVGRKGSWKDDPAIPSGWQSPGVPSPYSRGHQIASGDRQCCTGANKQTFYHSNQAPQWQTRFNDGVWNQLEQRIQGEAPTGRDTIYVVTGPLYEAGYKTETDRAGDEVPVPTGYWKCVMKCSFNSSGEMTAASGTGYLFDRNGEYNNTSYSNFSTTIDEIESVTGFDLFANIPESLQDAAESGRSPLF